MEHKRNRFALAAFICSIVPFLPVAILVSLCLYMSIEGGNYLEGLAEFFMFVLFVFMTAGFMMSMGIISLVFGTIAIRKPGQRSKTISIVTTIIGILDIMVAIILGALAMMPVMGFLLLVFSS
jgi:hypothetical protein